MDSGTSTDMSGVPISSGSHCEGDGVGYRWQTSQDGQNERSVQELRQEGC